MGDAAREVENLLYRYAEAIDAGDFDAVGALFKHGRICSEGPEGPVTIAQGAAAIGGFYRDLVMTYDDGTPRTRHVTTNAIVTVDEDSASATSRSSYTVFQQVGERPIEPIVIGRYADTFHRIEGEWWFDARVFSVDLKGDLSRHLRG
ncbi:nuclear transport factor 2 family protein [Nocardioides humilatus]|uniref:Nuclear transport factor 2 family protein n=1 Tax=Nocardioides humilatus TaxID=2607660 RepID=A0A5B1LDE8_9ACTN|nr:nuclear transport factor 2 family protein [Nocardioides humilatus]KAA1418763.1 nuclear transport factor 2 family protein [Nocardioides humilatus]